MLSDTHTAPVSKKMLWAGYSISALPVLMLLFSGVMKLVKRLLWWRASFGLDTPRVLLWESGSSSSPVRPYT